MTRRPEPPPLPAEAQDVARLLGEDIIFGRLAPGSRLVEDPLMARFGATRHGVRRALAELERIGIVVREKNKGASVRALAATEVRQIYEVRELLQRQAALRIRCRPTPRWSRHWRRCNGSSSRRCGPATTARCTASTTSST